jgi:RHS repeat-associated protein
MQQITAGWLSSTNESLVWLHTNHLGAPEAATDAAGHIVWRASYAPFGAATVIAASASASAKDGVTGAVFQLNLRLPGQVFDPETGLHYNRQRYYDPQHGQYLTPDPLGTPDGPNPYAYVAFNPLTNIDPDGLILFAFDGTRNNRDSQTNVFWLDRAYNGNDSRDIANSDRPYYEEGPGVDSSADGAIAYSLSGRINNQLQRLDSYVSAKWRSEAGLGRAFTRSNPLVITLDIVGFSRGAAAARDFANRVVIRNRNGYYRQRPEVRGGCVTVLIRFMGLFDTVASTNISSLNLAIPDAVRHVAHAVAVNEHRATFPGESIERLSDVGFSGNRIERGFIGAHSDVGGAYDCRPGSANCNESARGDLSDVALNWMWQQAVAAGVPMNALLTAQRTVSNPVLHDESRVSPWVTLQLGRTDRSFYYGAQSVPQRQAQLQGMTTAQSETYITRRAQPNGNVVGDVNMATYRQWLQTNLNVNMQ